MLMILLLLFFFAAVQGMYELMEIGQSIVFCSTKNGCDAVTAALQAVGFGCSNLHGGLKGEDRDACMDDFRFGRKKVGTH
jgi:superfamily II DNA/RNA helicase